MCPKMLKKSTKNQNTLTNLITSLSYIPQFDQLHFLNVSPWWWINIDCTEGWSDYQKSREKYLIVWSSVQDGGGEDDWDVTYAQVELPEHSGRMSLGRPHSPLSTTVSTSPPPSAPVFGSWIAEMSVKQQKWQRRSTRKPSMYLSWPSEFHKAIS